MSLPVRVKVSIDFYGFTYMYVKKKERTRNEKQNERDGYIRRTEGWTRDRMDIAANRPRETRP